MRHAMATAAPSPRARRGCGRGTWRPESDAERRPAGESAWRPDAHRAWARCARAAGGCSSAITRQPDSRELPSGRRGEEIAIAGAKMRCRGDAGTAAQDVLVAHEFAVVFPDRAAGGPIAGIGVVAAASPLPDVAEKLPQRPACSVRGLRSE